MDWLWERLKERSTWVGIIGFLSAIGLTFTDIQKDSIIALGVALVAAILAFTKDKA